MVRNELYSAVQKAMNQEENRCGFKRYVSFTRAKEVTETVLDVLAVAIRDNEKVYLNRLGSFKHTIRKPRRVISMITGEEMIIPEREKIEFEVARNFCEGLEDVKIEIEEKRNPDDDFDDVYDQY